MAKINLTFARTEYDMGSSWTAIKSIPVEVPDELLITYEDMFEWQLIGCEWEGRK